MNWFERNVHWVVFTLFAVTSIALVGVVGVGILAILAGILGGATVGALLADVALVLGTAVLLLAIDVTLAVGLVVTVLRRASLPRSDRLATFFGLLERLVPPIRGLALSDRFAPTLEDREREIKRRYVEGTLSEPEFEREMRALLDEAEPSPPATGPVDVPRERVAESLPAYDASDDTDRAVERE